MKILGSNIKKFQEMETPKKIIYISGNGNSKKDSYISGNETFQSTQKKVLFQEMETLKWKPFLYFLKRKLFLYFRKQKLLNRTFLYFRMNLKDPKNQILLYFPKKGY